MVYRPTFDRYDGFVIVGSLVLLFFAYVVYPTHMVKVSTWFLVFTMYLSWMAYLLYKFAFYAESS